MTPSTLPNRVPDADMEAVSRMALRADAAPSVIGYYDASEGRGGTTRYLMELLQGLDRQQFTPVFFALEPRVWHDDVSALNVPIILPQHEPTAIPTSVELKSRQQNASLDTDSSHSNPGMMQPPQKSARGRRLIPSSVAWTLGQGRDCSRLIHLFRQHRVDLLHTNETGSELAPIAARLAGVPHVVGTWHVDSTYDLDGARQSAKYRLLERCSMRALHAAIAVSEDTRRDWIQRCNLGTNYKKRTSVIYNGIEAEEDEGTEARRALRGARRAQFGLPDEAIVIGSLGRLAPAKGYTYLIEAFARLRPSYPRLHLALAGSGPEEVALRALAVRHGVQDYVHFLGFVADTRLLLACLDIYVQPSLCETLGIAILEACALELPVVASRVGGIPEVIVDGVTGRLVEARNSAALAVGLTEMLSNPVRARQMGQEGRKRVLTHFTRADMVARTAAIYAQALRTTS